ncbi:MAG: magnesium protoporphyrin IX methyltransferase [Beijerinckiaceae bacterium]|nr:magnesium protoporphyrin IX methyltransferase [Beijerinckiaceae bacterium]
MSSVSYQQRRSAVQTYFDRTAVDAWARLTSDEPVSRIRATVRAGRDEMRAMLLSWLPADMTGKRLLDAGCGTGALAVEAARRGAHVVAIDVAPTLISLAGSRAPTDLGAGAIDFRVGDMLDPALGAFDHVVSMDALIHYEKNDAVRALASLAERTSTSIIFTFAPRTPFLGAMHSIGKMFPRSDRSPAIQPVAPSALERAIASSEGLAGWAPARSIRVKRGFYISQGMELKRS